MRQKHRALVYTVLVGLLFSIPALAQQNMAWQLRDSEGMIFLAYEVPETSDQSLVLTCETQTRRFALHYHDDRDRARDGMRAAVQFASEGGRKSLQMLAEKQELGDQVILRAETPLDAPMIAILTGRQLRITLSDATENIPLTAAQFGVAALVGRCRSE